MRRKRGSSRNQPEPRGPSRKNRAELDEIAKKFGVEAPKPGRQMDIKYNPESSTGEAQQKTLYLMLVDMLGVNTLQVLEKLLGITLATLMAAFLSLGTGIAVEAFFKATGRAFPEKMDDLLSSAEPAFTPIFILFLALSSIFGLYKQSQLNSGITGYSENTDRK